jgi:hypothetical protein
MSSYRESLSARLDIMKPSRELLNRCVSDPPKLTRGIRELVAALHAKGTKVGFAFVFFHFAFTPARSRAA